MGQLITQVDAFTDRPFAGNPAAVCLLAAPASEQWMRDVAREMNLSETAFLVRRRDDDDGFDLRWFSRRSRSRCAGTPRSPALTSCGKRNTWDRTSRRGFTRRAVC